MGELSDWLNQTADRLINGDITDGDVEAAKLVEAAAELDRLNARVKELEEHNRRLGQGGAERYWEGRYRDEAAANSRIEAETIERAAIFLDERADKLRAKAARTTSPSEKQAFAKAVELRQAAYAIRQLSATDGKGK